MVLSKSRWGMLSLLLAFITLSSSMPVLAAVDRFPDLQMARLRDLQIENTSDRRRLLRFSAVIANLGEGAFELLGQRSSTSSPWTVYQRIYDGTGNARSVATPATLVYGGDGHNHWHVRDLQTYELLRLDNGVKVGTGFKGGFCFFDNEIIGSLVDDVYRTSITCRGGPSGLKTMMGLSPGWADVYGATLPDQYIDITGLAAGQYRLMATADKLNWFSESDETNNATWVDLQLTGNGFNIQGYGPFATPHGNLLKNRRFEVDYNNDGLPEYWSSNASFTRSNALVFEGSYGGRHSATNNSGYSISQTMNNVYANTSYTFSAAVNIPSTSDAFDLMLRLAWYDINGVLISNAIVKTYTDDTNGAWERVMVNLVAPPGTARAQVRMVVSSLNATIYVDDFTFGSQ